MAWFQTLPASATWRALPHAVWQRLDARWFQIGFLLGFLLLGARAHDFALRPRQVMLAVVTALLTQALWQWALRLPTRAQWGGYLSALISSWGLGILVRSDADWPFALLACLAISSKYLIRLGPQGRKSHVLNPANFAAFVAFVAWAWLPACWLNPGQWGGDNLALLWFLALGGVVTHRVVRPAVPLAFLLAWGLLLAGRLLWMGTAWGAGSALWLQQLGNGVLLLFAFFMVSDPMTTPQHPRACIACAVLVALAAFVWQYPLHRPHALVIMLFFANWTVSLWNRFWPRQRFAWDGRRRPRPA